MQNTAWRNAERALARMREAGLFDVGALLAIEAAALEAVIRPAGTYRRKARTIRALAAWLAERPGATVEAKLAGPLDDVRRSLLTVPGVGPETAAAILLYAGGRPVFVPDAYAKRILVRHGLVGPRAGPRDVAAWFEAAATGGSTLHAELHAHVVSTGQEHCRPREARCEGCPFGGWPFPGTPSAAAATTGGGRDGRRARAEARAGDAV